ncbi:SPFH domain-containing protein [Streptomyces mayteni]
MAVVFLVVLVGLAAGAGWLAVASRRLVPAGRVGIVTRRFGRGDGRFRWVTPEDARGVQARGLVSGRTYWLDPVRYSVEFVDATRVPAGHIGLVTARDGMARPPDRTLGRAVDCDNFQDGERFLLAHGEQGQQVATLAGDATYHINTALFTVETVRRTHVPEGTVGLVIARDGRVRPPDRPFGRFVECDNFQNGDAFLRGGGEQGRQLAILTGGTYYDINPRLFDVVTTETVGPGRRSGHGLRDDGLTARHLRTISIPVGHTGVVVVLDGDQQPADEEQVGPVVPGHRNFRLPWVFLAGGGRRGVQRETLTEGSVYAVNPWFVRVLLIPTRLLSLEWTKRDSAKASRYDAELLPITVNIQGYRLNVELSQNLQIPEAAAPLLVSKFGGDTTTSGLGGLVDDPVPVQRFVERVLGSTVETYFNAIAASSTVEDFLTEHASNRTDLAAQVRNALAAWSVRAEATNMGLAEAEEPELDAIRQRIFVARMRGQELAEQEENAERLSRIREIEQRTEKRQRQLDAAVLEREIELLGQDTVAMRLFLAELKVMKVPEVVSGNADELLRFLPVQRALDLIDRAKLQARPPALPKEGDAGGDPS